MRLMNIQGEKLQNLLGSLERQSLCKQSVFVQPSVVGLNQAAEKGTETRKNRAKNYILLADCLFILPTDCLFARPKY